jgi:septum formation protein
MKVILASGSPRRRELMEQAGISFEIDTADVDETVEDTALPADYVTELSLRKAEAVAVNHTSDLVIGADTIVAFEDRILGKPGDEARAYEMLYMLAGKTHSVYTGVSMIYPGEDGRTERETFHVRTDVTMYPPDEKLLREYASCGEPLDKAGAYGIQGKGALLVERIEGDYYNVMGLPIAELYRRIKNGPVWIL